MRKMSPSKPRSGNPFEWFFNHKDIVITTNYFMHNEGQTITIEDIEKAYGYSKLYQKGNLLKHMESFEIITKTKGGYKLRKTSTIVKSLKKAREVLLDKKPL